MRFARSLHRASQSFSRTFAEKMNGHAITVTQFLVLDALQARGRPAIQTDLVDVTEIDRSTLSEMLRRLAERGLVTRKLHKGDFRALDVSITTDGKRILIKARAAMEKAERSFAASAVAADLRSTTP